MAQVEVLDWILADVPLELVQTLILFRSQEFEEEVESHFALTVKTCIFVHSQLHDFEMEYAGLSLCVEDFHPYSALMCLKLFCSEPGHFLVNFDLPCAIPMHVLLDLFIEIPSVLGLNTLSIEKFWADDHLAFEHHQSLILLLIIVLCVRDVVLVRLVDLVVFHPTSTSVSFLLFSVKHLTRDRRPSLKFAFLVQCGEEAVLLPPDQVASLLAHANALNLIHVGERHNCHLVIVNEERESIAKVALVYQTTLSANCCR